MYFLLAHMNLFNLSNYYYYYYYQKQTVNFALGQARKNSSYMIQGSQFLMIVIMPLAQQAKVRSVPIVLMGLVGILLKFQSPLILRCLIQRNCWIKANTLSMSQQLPHKITTNSCSNWPPLRRT